MFAFRVLYNIAVIYLLVGSIQVKKRAFYRSETVVCVLKFPFYLLPAIHTGDRHHSLGVSYP